MKKLAAIAVPMMGGMLLNSLVVQIESRYKLGPAQLGLFGGELTEMTRQSMKLEMFEYVLEMAGLASI